MAEHGQVVGAIAHSNSLLQHNALSSSNILQKRGFAFRIHNVTHYLAGHFAVYYPQFVGIHIVNAQTVTQIFAHILEAAGEQRHSITKVFKGADQLVCAIVQHYSFCHFMQHTGGHAFQQHCATPKTFFEIYPASHGIFGNGNHLLTYTMALGQLIHHLFSDQGGIHVKGYEATVAPEHSVSLHAEIKTNVVCDTQ